MAKDTKDNEQTKKDDISLLYESIEALTLTQKSLEARIRELENQVGINQPEPEQIAPEPTPEL